MLSASAVAGPIGRRLVLCTLKNKIHSSLADDVCDIIFFNNFYASGNVTFVNNSLDVFQWFLDYAGSHNGSTEYGIGIEHGKELDAYNDLNTAVGEAALREFWSVKLRHYGLLNFPVHDALMPTEETATNYDRLLKRLRSLQEVNRAGAVDEHGYLILGIGLYAPRTGKVHDYLKDLLQ
ncbi:hypothetical protein IscW_ISCW012688 [Ixodes scapularis]|uniref:Uncharacterized protein n=1 Tax=Ixodes scapularis TaxID=6945 RepID=B7QG03_IXOSC|nr:hypothetical protein IscW_ISCW012688 [Ixodes scapularis]|eukprot:XP_002401068.1 hypothetical protein IscW_ISCW012688 [Ixodes scapularis]